MYPNISDPKFYKKLFRKKEIYDNQSKDSTPKKGLHLEPQQALLSNFMTPSTPYDSLLVYHDTGVGKTGAAIAIADKFIDFVKKTGNKTLVLVKSDVIADNFRNEVREPFTITYEEVVKEFSDADLKEELDNLTNARRTKGPRKIIKDIGSGEKATVLVKEDLSRTFEIVNHATFVNRTIGRTKDTIGEEKSDKRNITGSRITNISNRLVIIDEAHNLIGNEGYTALREMLRISKNVKLVLLTATPLFDNATELLQLLNLLNPNANIKDPSSAKTINKYFETSSIQSNTKSKLPGEINLGKDVFFVKKSFIPTIRSLVKGRISYLRVDPKTFPKRIDVGESITDKPGSLKIVRCEMSKLQWNSVVDAISKDSETGKGSSVAFNNASAASTFVSPVKSNGINLYGSEGYKSAFKEGKMDKAEKEKLNKVQGLLSGSSLKEFSTKCYRAIKNIQKSKGPVFVYSDRVTEGGITIFYNLLQLNGFKKSEIVLFTSKLNKTQGRRLLETFNSEKNKHGELKKVILGTRKISEGITLKSIRQIHILEPDWNYSRLKQISGRGIRNRSHEFLHPSERSVEVFMYAAVPPKYVSIFSIDELKYHIIEQKSRSISAVQRVFKEMAFDCALHHKRNILDKKYNNTEMCDYSICDYSCDSGKLKKYVSGEHKIDYSTYHDSISKSKHKIVQKKIKELFNHSSYWSFNQMVEKLGDPKEIIAIALQDILQNNVQFNDIYNRKGYIRYLGYYYVFQPNDLSIDASSFDRIKPKLGKPKGNLSNFLDTIEKDIPEKTEKTSKKKSTKSVSKTVAAPKSKAKGKENKAPPKEIRKVDFENEKNKFIASHEIYGSYVNRYGKLDNTFRIVDSIMNNTTDARKIQTGVSCGTGKFNKVKLQEVANRLGLTFNEKDGNTTLCKLIEDHLKSKGLIIGA